MPIKAGKSKAVIAKNMEELMKSKPSAMRMKGMATMMKKGMSKSEARRKQSAAIAYSKAKKSK